MSTEPTNLCATPNQHSRPPSLRMLESVAIFHGYQEYALTRETVSPLLSDWPLGRKYDLLKDHVSPRQFAGRTILDLGSNSGFFAFWALQQGAVRGTSVDIDPEYVRMLRAARDQFGFALEPRHANVGDWTEGADCVFALALIHWLYSCTATKGSLHAVVGSLAALTGYLLVVEYVDPEDSAIRDFHHLDWNPHIAQEPYSREAFEAALSSHFVRWTRVGDVIPTRTLYLAFKTRHDIDLRCPLPRLHPDETILACRLLTTNEKQDYWSVVYDVDGVIRKQTTGDLATREGTLLSRLASPYFPRVLATRREQGYEVVDIEQIDGRLLSDVADELRHDEEALTRFVRHLPPLLRELKKAGITHRDIHPDNVLVRDGQPVLIDFGWAIASDLPLFVPDGLRATREPRAGGVADDGPTHCDVRAMARLVCWLAPDRYPAMQAAVELFESSEPTLRLADREQRRTLFEMIIEAGGSSDAPAHDARTATALALTLIEQIGRRDRVIAESRDELRSTQAMAEADVAAAQSSAAAATEILAGVRNELAGVRAERDGARDELADRIRAHEEALAALGQTEHELGVARVALETLGRAHRTEPHAALSRVLAPRSKHDDADWTLDADTITLLFRYAQALRAVGATALARDVAARVLRHGPGQTSDEEWLSIMHFVGSVRRELGHYKEALEVFEAIVTGWTDDAYKRYRAAAFFHSGLIYEARGELTHARECFAACATIQPDHQGARDGVERLDPARVR